MGAPLVAPPAAGQEAAGWPGGKLITYDDEEAATAAAACVCVCCGGAQTVSARAVGASGGRVSAAAGQVMAV